PQWRGYHIFVLLRPHPRFGRHPLPLDCRIGSECRRSRESQKQASLKKNRQTFPETQDPAEEPPMRRKPHESFSRRFFRGRKGFAAGFHIHRPFALSVSKGANA